MDIVWLVWVNYYIYNYILPFMFFEHVCRYGIRHVCPNMVLQIRWLVSVFPIFANVGKYTLYTIHGASGYTNVTSQ
jgi:hypothetical protein